MENIVIPKDFLNEIQTMANHCLNCKTKPCTKGCPLGNDIPMLIQFIKQENWKEAYHVLERTTFLPSICGRICPHSKQCEGNCVRGIKDIPVSIGKLEAFVGDLAIHEGYTLKKEMKTKPFKVAIIGSGPAGLNCAGLLAKKGYDVTIFEKENELGGILVHGIPEFRLDKNIVHKTIQNILDLGIKVKTNQELGQNFSLRSLQKQYDVIVLSIGANTPSKLNIPGEDAIGVYGANFLLQYQKHPDYTHKKVAIIRWRKCGYGCCKNYP